MQRISVRKHDNLRPLCDLVISDADYAKLLKPPPLQDHFKAIVSTGSDGRPAARIVNALQGEAHMVEIATASGKLRVFPVSANGTAFVATNTPNIAVVNAA